MKLTDFSVIVSKQGIGRGHYEVDILAPDNRTWAPYCTNNRSLSRSDAFRLGRKIRREKFKTLCKWWCEQR